MTIEELKNSSIKDTLYSNYDMFSPLIISMLKNNEITYANFAEFVVHIDRNNTLVTYLRNITEIHDILADLMGV